MHEAQALAGSQQTGGRACIADAHVIDGTAVDPIAHGFVAIEDGRITAVGPMERLDLDVPADVPRIDAGGRTIIPGLRAKPSPTFSMSWQRATNCVPPSLSG